MLIKTLIGAATGIAIASAAFADSGYQVAGNNLKVTFTHVGGGCMTFTTDKYGPNMVFAIPATTKLLVDGMTEVQPAPNAQAMQDDVSNHATKNSPIDHFKYYPDLLVQCEDGPGYFARDLDSYFPPRP